MSAVTANPGIDSCKHEDVIRIAYLEKEDHSFSHVADVDGFYLAQKGDQIMFRETRVIRRESVPVQDGFQTIMVDVDPPRVEILSEHPVANWVKVPNDTPLGVHKPGAFPL